LVLTIPDGSASMVKPTAHTILPKVGKVDTSSVEAPTVWALVTRPGSMVRDDNPSNNEPNLLDQASTYSSHFVSIISTSFTTL
jgi:hypothetical protein